MEYGVKPQMNQKDEETLVHDAFKDINSFLDDNGLKKEEVVVEMAPYDKETTGVDIYVEVDPSYAAITSNSEFHQSYDLNVSEDEADLVYREWEKGLEDEYSDSTVRTL